MATVMTNIEFDKYLMEYCGRTKYGKGGLGESLTQWILDSKANQYPEWYYASATIGGKAQYNSDGTRMTNYQYLHQFVGKGYYLGDCVGIQKGILWGYRATPYPNGTRGVYKSNGVPDATDSDWMYKYCDKIKTLDRPKTVKDLKYVKGAILHAPGHIGEVHSPENDQVIECAPSVDGLVNCPTKFTNQSDSKGTLWDAIGYSKFIEYIDYDTKFAVGDEGSTQNVMNNIEYKKEDQSNGKIQLVYVDGYKYLPFNNFRNKEWASNEVADRDTSIYYNALSDSLWVDNTPYFSVKLNCKNTFAQYLTASINVSEMYIDYTFPDCDYSFKFVLDYKSREIGNGFATVSAYAKSQTISSTYTNASRYKNWVKVGNTTTALPTSEGLKVELIGYVRNQSNVSTTYNNIFKPMFVFKIGTSQTIVFDFEGHTLKEDLTTCYKGNYPRLQVHNSGVYDKLTTRDSDMVVNVRADTITSLSKI